MKKRIVIAASSLLGCGYLPVAPGTWGSAAAYGSLALIPRPGLVLECVLLAILCAVAVPVCTSAERHWGRKDDGRIVLDEAAGAWCSVLALPRTPAVLITAFVLFRIFDVVKPLGIRQSQRLPGGWGIVVDDVLAGLLANGILRAVGGQLGWF